MLLASPARGLLVEATHAQTDALCRRSRFCENFQMIVQSRAAKQGYVRYSAQMLHANISEKLLASLSHHI
jgi:hypothetical protein